LPDDGDEFEGTKLETPSGRPAHLKREIIAPSRIRESMTSESPSYMDDDYEDNVPSPESPPSPSPRRGGRGSRGGKRGRPRGSGSARGRKTATPARKEVTKIKLPSYPTARIVPAFGNQSNQKRENGCFIEYCDHNPNATLFKMPQQTKAKLKDWLRYIPAAALSNVPFDPRIHFLCEEHFVRESSCAYFPCIFFTK